MKYAHFWSIGALAISACSSSPNTPIDAAVDRIGARLLSMGEQEVPSEKIGELVMKELKKLDKVAYIRFASVYRNFADVDEFAEVIREVQTRPRRGKSDKGGADPEHDLFGG